MRDNGFCKLGDRQLGRRQFGLGHQRRQAPGLTQAAIKIAACSGSFWLGLMPGRMGSVLMLMMTYMAHRGALLMLTIRCHCCPGHLERHQRQQQNGDKLAHAANFISLHRRPRADVGERHWPRRAACPLPRSCGVLP